MKSTSLKVAVLLFSFLSIVFGYGQIRYEDQIFNDVNRMNGILFASAIPQPISSAAFTGVPANVNVKEHETTPVDLYMDLYEGSGDALVGRAAIVLCFGGGFSEGSRTLGDIQTLANTFAKKGYVVAAIDYRTGINVFDINASHRALYRGVQDSRAAIRFLRANAAQYGIDGDKIYLGGPSAGGMIALHNNFLDEAERTLGTKATSYFYTPDGVTPLTLLAIPDLGCLDCVGGHQEFSGRADAVVAFAGAMGDLSFIDGPNNVASLLFHSTDDPIVPYDSGVPFGGDQTQLPEVYGGGAIAKAAALKSAPVTLVSFTDRGHNVHTPDGTAIYAEGILDEMTNFLSSMASEGMNLHSEEPRNNAIFQIASNPVTQGQSLALSIGSGIPEPLRIQIFDLNGAVVFQDKIEAPAANQAFLLEDTVFSHSGMYVLVLETKANSYTQKIVVE